MTVYVDDVRHTYGQMIMCHMWSDELDELLAMADQIGVARRWLQKPPRASWVHFDISLGKKRLAIEAGAVLTDKYGPIVHVFTPLAKSPNLEIAAYAQRKLLQVHQARLRRPAAPID